MRADLAVLLNAVRAGELETASFYDRLEEIHRRHLGTEAGSEDWVEARLRAVRIFDGLGTTEASRHHQLEALAESLGIGP